MNRLVCTDALDAALMFAGTRQRPLALPPAHRSAQKTMGKMLPQEEETKVFKDAADLVTNTAAAGSLNLISIDGAGLIDVSNWQTAQRRAWARRCKGAAAS